MEAAMELRFCNVCKKETRHRRLEKLGFLGECLVAALTRFSADLRQPDFECNECGSKCNA